MTTVAGSALVRALQENLFFPYRLSALTRRLGPYLGGVTSVLDVGASCGRLARRLAHATGCAITGVDVLLQPTSYVEVILYDGQTLPFNDGAFDCVMMIDMLHHCLDIKQIVREARRVARRYVLIKDHHWDTAVDWACLCVADYLGNAPYGIALPYQYLRIDEWAGLFRRTNLAVVSQGAWRYFALDPCKQFVVKLADHPADPASPAATAGTSALTRPPAA